MQKNARDAALEILERCRRDGAWSGAAIDNAIKKYGFEKINLHKVQICTKTINKASKRVIEKCGFILNTN